MKSSLKVLLIENSNCYGQIMRNFISEIEGFHAELSMVRTLTDAIKLLHLKSFDVVLSDLNLPETKGIHSFREVIQMYPKIPFIILTSTDNYFLLPEANRVGIQDYLVKSDLTPGNLHRSIRYAIERKESEFKRRKLESRLIESQKLEALERLSGSIGNDFNNKMKVIHLEANTLMRNLESHPEAQTIAKNILSTTKTAMASIQQLLGFSRKQHLNSKLINLHKFIEENKESITSIFGVNIEVLIECDSEMENINTDPNQLLQALLNLAENSKDAMTHGGQFTIKVNTVQGDFFVANANNYIELSIIDTGQGMNPHTLEHIFDPFFTTKKHKNGLGLSMVYGLVKQSGGFMKVESDLGHGTHFKLFFPEEIPEEIKKMKSKDTVILYVDDEEEIRIIMKSLLEGEGFTVLDAKNGADALEVFNNEKERIDILLTDIIMPKMSGNLLANEIRKINPEIKVLYISGYTQDKLLEDNKKNHPEDEIIYKPFDFNVLLETLNKVLKENPAAIVTSLKQG